MCGRFTLHSQLNLILQEFATTAPVPWAPRYNIAPTQDGPVIRWDAPLGGRSFLPVRWGLVPSWADDLRIGQRMINARAETVATKPAFRAAFRRRRCIVPADGYYEWQSQPTGKQPFLIQATDGLPFAMAGLWESWRGADERIVETFTIITTSANERLATVHDRMPVLLDAEDLDIWLDPEFQEVPVLIEYLRPCDADRLEFLPVSTYVNSPRHEGPQCIVPQAAGPT